jgi:glyoxylase-like metal-dependent hydrolase (beta-lactamase superfamily II)
MGIRWDVVFIGNLSRNRYWNEADDRPRRSVLSTTTLVSNGDFRLIVDPSISDATRMAAELDRRAGIAPAAIDAVFVTHEHGDHHAGLDAFPDARWLAAPEAAERINGLGRRLKRIEPVEGFIAEGIECIATPGHTNGHHSVLFADADGYRVVIAGDAVVTRDFWRDARGYFNSSDAGLASDTIKRLGGMVDIVVPGHDNYFICARR